MTDPLRAAGDAVVESFAACAAAPDDVAVGAAADAALGELDRLIRDRDR